MRAWRVRHPCQPVVEDAQGVYRFKGNAIVDFLLSAGPFDMNKLAQMPWSRADRVQFAQLIGYSVSGFGELGYIHEKDRQRADAAVGRHELRKAIKRTKGLR